MSLTLIAAFHCPKCLRKFEGTVGSFENDQCLVHGATGARKVGQVDRISYRDSCGLGSTFEEDVSSSDAGWILLPSCSMHTPFRVDMNLMERVGCATSSRVRTLRIMTAEGAVDNS